MPKTEKARITNQQWQNRNFSTLACKVYKGDAAEFRDYAAAKGRTVNDLFREYVAACLGRPLERRTVSDPPDDKPSERG